MRRQIPLSQAAKVIRTQVEQGDNSGYAGIELTDNQVLVWWKGAMPAPVAQAVTRARSIAPVQVNAAAHSLRQLQAAGAKIRAAWADTQPRIRYAVDGSRVTVAVPATAHRRGMPDVGVPVDVVDQLTKVPTSRVDDWAPWIGGADQINGSARCTTGFPVRTYNRGVLQKSQTQRRSWTTRTGLIMLDRRAGGDSEPMITNGDQGTVGGRCPRVPPEEPFGPCLCC